MPSGPQFGWKGSVEERFWSYVFKTENCWFWIGSCNSDGYGSIKVNKVTAKAHVLSYELHFGKQEEGVHILHTCDIPQCVRPDHLYTGSHLNNMRDRAARGTMGQQVLRTHCPKGHEYNPENTYIGQKTGYRYCKTCRRLVIENRRLTCQQQPSL